MRPQKSPENKESNVSVPEYKKTWEKIKEDPELRFVITSESYDKAILILLYRILDKLEER